MNGTQNPPNAITEKNIKELTRPMPEEEMEKLYQNQNYLKP